MKKKNTFLSLKIVMFILSESLVLNHMLIKMSELNFKWIFTEYHSMETFDCVENMLFSSFRPLLHQTSCFPVMPFVPLLVFLFH